MIRNRQWGFVINKQASSLKLGDLYEKLDIGAPRFAVDDPVHIGGPVDSNRGFVLHSQDHMLPDSMAITHEIGLTASIEILRDITGGIGPSHTIVSLGCSGWGAGQLDREMNENVWLNLPASTDLVFEHDRETLWQQAFDAIGIDPAYFAGDLATHEPQIAPQHENQEASLAARASFDMMSTDGPTAARAGGAVAIRSAASWLTRSSVTSSIAASSSASSLGLPNKHNLTC